MDENTNATEDENENTASETKDQIVAVILIAVACCICLFVAILCVCIGIKMKRIDDKNKRNGIDLTPGGDVDLEKLQSVSSISSFDNSNGLMNEAEQNNVLLEAEHGANVEIEGNELVDGNGTTQGGVIADDFEIFGDDEIQNSVTAGKITSGSV